MVQEFYILKCCSCNFFQVHIVKKAKTWVCKMCSSKQSVIKVYGQGTAKECRLHVQKLNQSFQSQHDIINEAHADNVDYENVLQPYEDDDHEYYSQPSQNEISGIPTIAASSKRRDTSNSEVDTKKSKWSKYVDEETHFEATRASSKSKWGIFTDNDNENSSLFEL